MGTLCSHWLVRAGRVFLKRQAVADGVSHHSKRAVRVFSIYPTSGSGLVSSWGRMNPRGLGGWVEPKRTRRRLMQAGKRSTKEGGMDGLVLIGIVRALYDRCESANNGGIGGCDRANASSRLPQPVR